MDKGKLYVVSGPSGSGKDTLVSRYLELNGNTFLSVSATTRKMRKGDTDGVDYHFISLEQFENMINNDELLEWAKYCENYYGTPKKPISDNLNNGVNVILIIEVQGAQQIKQKMPEAVSIFIMPPSAEVLEERLRNRATESDGAVAKRLDVAKREMALAPTYDYTIINDNLDTAVSQLSEIINNK